MEYSLPFETVIGEALFNQAISSAEPDKLVGSNSDEKDRPLSPSRERLI